jgi:hypothetical protein
MVAIVADSRLLKKRRPQFTPDQRWPHRSVLSWPTPFEFSILGVLRGGRPGAFAFNPRQPQILGYAGHVAAVGTTGTSQAISDSSERIDDKRARYRHGYCCRTPSYLGDRRLSNLGPQRERSQWILGAPTAGAGSYAPALRASLYGSEHEISDTLLTAASPLLLPPRHSWESPALCKLPGRCP